MAQYKISLKTYRLYRKCFIFSLDQLYNIDFFDLDVDERKEWLRVYILSQQDFFHELTEWWECCPPNICSKIIPLKRDKT
jgi:hypothetical protein